MRRAARRSVAAPSDERTAARGAEARRTASASRCWAWRFERDRRAFEYGAHDYGIGDRAGFHSANVRQRGLPPRTLRRRGSASSALFARSDCFLFRGARGGAATRSWADVVNCREGSRKRSRLIVLMIELMIAAIIT